MTNLTYLYTAPDKTTKEVKSYTEVTNLVEKNGGSFHVIYTKEERPRNENPTMRIKVKRKED